MTNATDDLRHMASNRRQAYDGPEGAASNYATVFIILMADHLIGILDKAPVGPIDPDELRRDVETEVLTGLSNTDSLAAHLAFDMLHEVNWEEAAAILSQHRQDREQGG